MDSIIQLLQSSEGNSIPEGPILWIPDYVSLEQKMQGSVLLERLPEDIHMKKGPIIEHPGMIVVGYDSGESGSTHPSQLTARIVAVPEHVQDLDGIIRRRYARSPSQCLYWIQRLCDGPQSMQLLPFVAYQSSRHEAYEHIRVSRITQREILHQEVSVQDAVCATLDRYATTKKLISLPRYRSRHEHRHQR